MTPDELCNAASVMLAAANGKLIDYREKPKCIAGVWNHPKWFGPIPPKELCFDWSACEYRVSPTQPPDQEQE